MHVRMNTANVASNAPRNFPQHERPSPHHHLEYVPSQRRRPRGAGIASAVDSEPANRSFPNIQGGMVTTKRLARHRGSYAKGRAPQPARRGLDSRGDNESWRDAGAARLAHVCVTLARRRQAPRSEARKRPRDPRRMLLARGRDFRPTIARPDHLGSCPLGDTDFHELSSRGDVRASRAPLRQKPFRHDRPQQWKEAVRPLAQA